MEIQLDPRELEGVIAQEAKGNSELRRELDRVVDQVADTVRELAPARTGRFRRSIRVRRHSGLEGLDGDGALVGEVFSDDDAAKVAAIEFGSEDTPEYAPFARAAFRHR
ncbi:hypothetical protein BST36_00305 [Mycolicibacterium moriokaense]|uniref:Uncharacterized protein n=2 Tax=Mycolicibacterium moriokaense TaxID=39691 RepID=A0AAD1H9U5_9MYCO|nr:hypothetical protein BST36_00305 [Mycolicibacterium moriokaense]BBX00801.1 hypothetical protein MMOR_17370 [Mycolicibacterium moriokaense]